MTCDCCNTSCPEPVDVTLNTTNVYYDGASAYFVRDSLAEGTLSLNTALTVATLSKTPVSANLCNVYINGVHQNGEGTDYTLSGGLLVFEENLQADDKLEVMYHSVMPSSVAGTVTIGSVEEWSADIAIKDGYLATNGAAVSRTTYAAAFAWCGTIYGAGDGSTTFNLPTWTHYDSGRIIIIKV